jgi:hypothetical protein
MFNGWHGLKLHQKYVTPTVMSARSVNQLSGLSFLSASFHSPYRPQFFISTLHFLMLLMYLSLVQVYCKYETQSRK